MSTQPQIHANRLNAQKSTGPKTPQGKAVVAQNALKHGLSARHDVIITESQEDFDLHRDSLLEELAPQGPMESILADRIVSLSWRLKRADRIQNQTFDAMDEQNKSNPLANLTKSFRLKALNRPNPQTADPQHDLTLGRIALKDFANARVLDRLLMYERRIENSLHKTLLELQRLTLIRNLTPSNQSNPNHPRLASAPVPGGTTERDNTHASPRLAPAPVAGGTTERDNPFASKTAHNSNRTTAPTPRTHKKTSRILPILPPNQASSAQNKPNPKDQKNTKTPAIAKDYKQKPPLADSKKQTQSNPILSRPSPERSPILPAGPRISVTSAHFAQLQRQNKTANKDAAQLSDKRSRK